MNESVAVQVSVRARGATATFIVDLEDPGELREFAQYALLQATRGEVVTVERSRACTTSR